MNWPHSFKRAAAAVTPLFLFSCRPAYAISCTECVAEENSFWLLEYDTSTKKLTAKCTDVYPGNGATHTVRAIHKDCSKRYPFWELEDDDLMQEGDYTITSSTNGGCFRASGGSCAACAAAVDLLGAQCTHGWDSPNSCIGSGLSLSNPDQLLVSPTDCTPSKPLNCRGVLSGSPPAGTMFRTVTAPGYHKIELAVGCNPPPAPTSSGIWAFKCLGSCGEIYDPGLPQPFEPELRSLGLYERVGEYGLHAGSCWSQQNCADCMSKGASRDGLACLWAVAANGETACLDGDSGAFVQTKVKLYADCALKTPADCATCQDMGMFWVASATANDRLRTSCHEKCPPADLDSITAHYCFGAGDGCDTTKIDQGTWTTYKERLLVQSTLHFLDSTCWMQTTCSACSSSSDGPCKWISDTSHGNITACVRMSAEPQLAELAIFANCNQNNYETCEACHQAGLTFREEVTPGATAIQTTCSTGRLCTPVANDFSIVSFCAGSTDDCHVLPDPGVSGPSTSRFVIGQIALSATACYTKTDCSSCVAATSADGSQCIWIVTTDDAHQACVDAMVLPSVSFAKAFASCGNDSRPLNCEACIAGGNRFYVEELMPSATFQTSCHSECPAPRLEQWASSICESQDCSALHDPSVVDKAMLPVIGEQTLAEATSCWLQTSCDSCVALVDGAGEMLCNWGTYADTSACFERFATADFSLAAIYTDCSRAEAVSCAACLETNKVFVEHMMAGNNTFETSCEPPSPDPCVPSRVSGLDSFVCVYEDCSRNAKDPGVVEHSSLLLIDAPFTVASDSCWNQGDCQTCLSHPSGECLWGSRGGTSVCAHRDWIAPAWDLNFYADCQSTQEPLNCNACLDAGRVFMLRVASSDASSPAAITASCADACPSPAENDLAGFICLPSDGQCLVELYDAGAESPLDLQWSGNWPFSTSSCWAQQDCASCLSTSNAKGEACVWAEGDGQRVLCSDPRMIWGDGVAQFSRKCDKAADTALNCRACLKEVGPTTSWRLEIAAPQKGRDNDGDGGDDVDSSLAPFLVASCQAGSCTPASGLGGLWCYEKGSDCTAAHNPGVILENGHRRAGTSDLDPSSCWLKTCSDCIQSPDGAACVWERLTQDFSEGMCAEQDAIATDGSVVVTGHCRGPEGPYADCWECAGWKGVFRQTLHCPKAVEQTCLPETEVDGNEPDGCVEDGYPTYFTRCHASCHEVETFGFIDETQPTILGRFSVPLDSCFAVENCTECMQRQCHWVEQKTAHVTAYGCFPPDVWAQEPLPTDTTRFTDTCPTFSSGANLSSRIKALLLSTLLASFLM